METVMLKDLLDWEAILKAPRYAGGHEEVMRVLFKDATVIADWFEGGYGGSEAFAYRLADGRVVIVTDSYGSCSGCDAWEGSSDNDARQLCTTLANDAHAFDTLEAAIAWIEAFDDSDGTNYGDRCARNLLPTLLARKAQP